MRHKPSEIKNCVLFKIMTFSIVTFSVVTHDADCNHKRIMKIRFHEQKMKNKDAEIEFHDRFNPLFGLFGISFSTVIKVLKSPLFSS